MPVIVSDTSPIRALAHLGHLAWLQEFFQEVRLPPPTPAN
jgi:predicted nucleic acid-binding protein